MIGKCAMMQNRMQDLQELLDGERKMHGEETGVLSAQLEHARGHWLTTEAACSKANEKAITAEIKLNDVIFQRNTDISLLKVRLMQGEASHEVAEKECEILRSQLERQMTHRSGSDSAVSKEVREVESQ